MVRFLFRHLKGYRFLVVVAIALTFVQVGASLLVAFPLKIILDKLVNHRDPRFPFARSFWGSSIGSPPPQVAIIRRWRSSCLPGRCW